MEEQKLGIKETKEVLVAVHAISLFLVERLKDGVGIDDGMAVVQKILMDGEFKSILGDALEKMKEVPAELGNLDMNEVIELVIHEASFLPKIIAAMKK